MVADAPQAIPAEALLTSTQERDRQRAGFALVLSAASAVLMALVPLIGKAAIAPILLTLVPLALWTAFRDTERAIYVYIAWCWVDGVIRGLLDQNAVAIVARDLVLALVLVGWGFQRLQTRGDNPLRCPPGTLLVALFVINCLLQIANPYSLGLVRSIGGLKLHLSAIPLFFIGYDVLRRREQLRSLFLFLTYITLVAGLVSLVQYLGGKEWTWAHFPGTKEVISQGMRSMTAGKQISEIASFKPPGTTGFGGGTSIFPAFTFPLTFALAMLSGSLRFTPRMKLCFYAFLMAFLVIILINSVRSALVVALSGVAVVILLIGNRLRTRIRVSLIVFAVLGLVAVGFSQNLSQGGVADRFGSTVSDPTKALHEDRQTFFENGFDIIRLSPFGVGMGRIGGAGRLSDSSEKDTLDFAPFSEAYLGSIIFETGLLGAVFMTSLVILLCVRGYRALADLTEPDDRFVLSAILSILAVIFFNLFLSPILFGPPGTVLFWLLGAAMLRIFPAPGPAAIGKKIG